MQVAKVQLELTNSIAAPASSGGLSWILLEVPSNLNYPVLLWLSLEGTCDR